MALLYASITEPGSSSRRSTPQTGGATVQRARASSVQSRLATIFARDIGSDQSGTAQGCHRVDRRSAVYNDARHGLICFVTEVLLAQDPITQHEDGSWWHYDETWCDEYGPFPTRIEAENALNRYCHWLDTGEVLT
jgi:hypothetical protein